MDTGEKTRRRAGEAKAFLNCGQTALKVSTVQELRELQQSMAKYKNLDVVENPLAAAAYGPGLRLVISKFDSHCKSEWL